LKEQEVEASLPAPRAVAAPDSEGKKSPVPAGRPPPPNPAREKTSTQTKARKGTDATPEDDPNKKDKTEEKVSNVSERGVAPPPKRAPMRRPPPPRQASFQSSIKAQEEKKPEEEVAAEPTVAKSETEQGSSVDKTEVKKAPVMKRPPAPRPQSRPRSMIVKSTQEVNSSIEEASNSTEEAINSTDSSAAVPGNTETDGKTEGAPAAVMRRPTAPRPSSRPRSMLVKSATVTGSSSDPKPTQSPAEKKKNPPQIKRPPAPRPLAPKRSLASNKEEAPPALTKDRVETSSNGKKAPETPCDAVSSVTDGRDTKPVEGGKTSELELSKDEAKKPTTPVGAKRPPPPRIPSRTEVKTKQVNSTAPSETSKTVINSESDAKKPEDGAPIPMTRSKSSSLEEAPDNKPALQTETESKLSPMTTQKTEQKTPPTLPSSPNKKLSIKRPPPPVSAKPKSRSPTPDAETKTEKSTTNSTSKALAATGASAQEKQSSPAPPSAPAQVSKKPSIKKPPPPVLVKPKSRSPTPGPAITTAPADLLSSSGPSAAPRPAPVSPTTSTKPPAATEPAATELAATEPTATEPAATESATTEPTTTEPTVTEPAATEVTQSLAKVLKNSGNQGREEKSTEISVADIVVEKKGEEESMEVKPSQPARPPPAARTRPPPPRAPQRSKLNKTPSTDGTGEVAKSPGSPTQVHTAPEPPANQSVSSPEQLRDNSIGKSPGKRTECTN